MKTRKAHGNGPMALDSTDSEPRQGYLGWGRPRAKTWHKLENLEATPLADGTELLSGSSDPQLGQAPYQIGYQATGKC